VGADRESYSVHQQTWPVWDEDGIGQESEIVIPVQVTARCAIASPSPRHGRSDAAHPGAGLPRVKEFLNGREPKKVTLFRTGW